MDWGQILGNTVVQATSPVTLAFILAALGLALHFGFGGLLNFGIAGFMAVGAYGYAIAVLTFGFPWWGGMLTGLVGSVILALIMGLPTLRLRGDYLAIVTIATAEILRLIFLTVTFRPVTGSADGLSEFNVSFRAANPIPEGSYTAGPWRYSANELWTFLFSLGVVMIAVFVLWALMRSPWGRVVKGIREDEDAVRALGKNVFSYKLQILIIGGLFASMGGIVYALPSNVHPSVYVTSLTFFVWTALLLGGAATIFGPVLGAVLFWIVQAFVGSLLPALINAGLLPFLSVSQTFTLRFILVGAGLMLLVIFAPQGILGKKEEMTFVK